MDITKICTAMAVNSQQNPDYGIHVDIDLHLPFFKFLSVLQAINSHNEIVHHSSELLLL
jgi:hypothetical protein